MKYCDQFLNWLADEGYTRCFAVAGGNIMHLLESASRKFQVTPFVHEVSAVIAAEYFNESNKSEELAFALVTAGPGLTNALTGMAGAYLESRQVLVVGGQVKSEDLNRGMIRQRGIQEIAGLEMSEQVTVSRLRIERPLAREEIVSAIRSGQDARRGPVFIEFCLDAQSAPALASDGLPLVSQGKLTVDSTVVDMVAERLACADRPVVLLGGGVTRLLAQTLLGRLEALGLPVATTWNGADRVPFDSPIYAGRPNTWGMRWANILIQEADVIVALGTRLGMQQTGFNWRAFGEKAKVIQVDIDLHEILKGHPRIDYGLVADANTFLAQLVDALESLWATGRAPLAALAKWNAYKDLLQSLLPLDDPDNETGQGYVSPYAFASWLSDISEPNDVLVPCSSGGAFTVPMQAFRQKFGQTIVTNKGLASMGYGLAGAVGASLANPDRRTILIEGDGGFAQNLQELGTVSRNSLNLKMFVFDNDGYASIRMTQKNYFDGRYVGCDSATGLGLPDWSLLARAYGIPFARMEALDVLPGELCQMLSEPGPVLVSVKVDPDQTYYPKISSRVTQDGKMDSDPLHRMSPELGPGITARLSIQSESRSGANESN